MPALQLDIFWTQQLRQRPHLLSRPFQRFHLGFNQRLEIAIDVAHGLTYLHLYAGTLHILSSSGNLVFFNSNHALVLLKTAVRK